MAGWNQSSKAWLNMTGCDWSAARRTPSLLEQSHLCGPAAGNWSPERKPWMYSRFSNTELFTWWVQAASLCCRVSFVASTCRGFGVLVSFSNLSESKLCYARLKSCKSGCTTIIQTTNKSWVGSTLNGVIVQRCMTVFHS